MHLHQGQGEPNALNDDGYGNTQQDQRIFWRWSPPAPAPTSSIIDGQMARRDISPHSTLNCICLWLGVHKQASQAPQQAGGANLCLPIV